MTNPTPPLIWLGEKRGISYYKTLEATQRTPQYLVVIGFYRRLRLFDVTGIVWQATLRQKPKIPFLTRFFDSKRIIQIDLNFEEVGIEDLESFKTKLIDQYNRYPMGFTKQFDNKQAIIKGIQTSSSMDVLFDFIAKTISDDT